MTMILKEAAKLTITVQNHEGYWIWSVETSDEQWDHCGGGETFYECMDDLKNNLEEIKKRIDISDD